MRMEERKRRKERRTRIEIAIGLAVVALLYLLQLFKRVLIESTHLLCRIGAIYNAKGKPIR